MTAKASPPANMAFENQVPTAPGFPLFTLERYHQWIEAGMFTEDDRLELMFGQIVAKMPIGELHAEAITLLNKFFIQRFGFQYSYRFQSPISLLNHSEPEPDFLIALDKSYNKSYGHPQSDDVVLLVEVADSSLSYDRGDKARLYALAGIKEYWIVNLDDEQLEIYTKPDVKAGNYRSIEIYKAEDRVSTELLDDFNLSELLP
ncbi:MAG: Uma2 family endonuclease [Bacteroidota bacterium]